MDRAADYTTLDFVRRAITQSDIVADHKDDSLLRDFITAASGFMNLQTGRWFVPWADTFSFDYHRPYVVDTYSVADLLEITALTNGDQVFDSPDFVLRPSNIWPKWRIELKQSAGKSFSFDIDWQEAISIEGIWGFHEDWPKAWRSTQENIPSGDLSINATSFTAVDADGLDTYGRQRFEICGYCKIDDEVVKVIDLNTTSNLVTISRGQLGTTPSAHNEATPIYRFVQTPSVEAICSRMTIWLYQHRDVSGGAIQLLNGAVLLNDRSLSDIYDVLETLVKRPMKRL